MQLRIPYFKNNYINLEPFVNFLRNNVLKKNISRPLVQILYKVIILLGIDYSWNENDVFYFVLLSSSSGFDVKSIIDLIQTIYKPSIVKSLYDYIITNNVFADEINDTFYITLSLFSLLLQSKYKEEFNNDYYCDLLYGISQVRFTIITSQPS